jgi:hypothetical protein
MKIAVLIPAYQRHVPLITLVQCLDQLASGQHDIAYRIAVDRGDFAAADACQDLLLGGVNVQINDMPAPPTLGEKLNALLAGPGADVYAFLADDQLPIMRHWDAGMAHCVKVHKLHTWCWNEVADHGNTTYPAITADMLRALGGQFFCEWFPYWHIDGWLNEIHELAFGHPIPIIEDMPLAGRRGKTSGGIRDAEFWFEFYAATRSIRITQAKRVAAYFGMNLDIRRLRAGIIHRMEQLDAAQIKRCDWYRAQMGDARGEPSARYLKAKENAQRWLYVNKRAPQRTGT